MLTTEQIEWLQKTKQMAGGSAAWNMYDASEGLRGPVADRSADGSARQGDDPVDPNDDGSSPLSPQHPIWQEGYNVSINTAAGEADPASPVVYNDAAKRAFEAGAAAGRRNRPGQEAVERGKAAAVSRAMIMLTSRQVAVQGAIAQWRDDAKDAVKKMGSSSAAIGKMILGATAAALGALVPGAGLLGMAAKETLEAAEKVASKIETASKGAEKVLDKEEDAAKEELDEAEAAIIKCADKAIQQTIKVLNRLKPTVSHAMDKLTDRDSIRQFTQATDEDLDALCERIVLSTDKAKLNGEINRLRQQLDHSLRNAMKEAAITKRSAEISDGSGPEEMYRVKSRPR